ncbi:MAG: hypothetical protein K1X29_07495 [Bdellovibrionales bacterium]|nr:hypothetical protein [Bdellovibrionales bacterium]
MIRGLRSNLNLFTKTIWIFFVLTAITLNNLPQKAMASGDLQMGLSGRTYPLGGTLNLESGYKILIWGSDNNQSPLQGYLRPSLQYKNAGQYNAGTLKLEFFPVSILGIAGGGESVSNNTKYKPFNCQTYQCLGKTWRTFVETTLKVGYGPWFVLGRGRLEDWHQEPGHSKDFIEPNSGLAAKFDGDRLKNLLVATGWKLNDHWTLLYTGIFAQMMITRGKSETQLGLVKWNHEGWEIYLGAGTYRSELKPIAVTAVLDINYKFVF